MLRPLRASQPGTQGVFELPVNSLNHPVGLRMVSGSELALDAELLAKAGPEGGDELPALVGSKERRHAKTRDPRGDESVCAGGRLDILERNRFQPASSAVDHGEKVSVPLRSSGERTDEIDVHVGEAVAWHRNGLHGGGGLLSDLRACAVLAVSAPCDYVLVDLLPDHPGSKEPPRGTNSRVGQLMKGVKNCSAVLKGYEGAWRGERDVTEDPNIAKLYQFQLKRRSLGGLNRWACTLSGGDGGQVQLRRAGGHGAGEGWTGRCWTVPGCTERRQTRVQPCRR